MAELRKCKECGKLFMPKGREKYCSADHYRPCPICGTLVIAKYLSDPPRKCDACKRHKTVSPAIRQKPLFNIDTEDESSSNIETIEKPESNESAEDWTDKIDTTIPELIDQAAFCKLVTGSTMIYIGPEIKNGFIHGHEYTMEVQKHDQIYWAIGKEDSTSGKEVNIVIPYTSQRSFYQNFARIAE